MQSPVLNREQAVERLAGCEREVRALGVARLALFGSVLRGQTHAQSDVDLLVQYLIDRSADLSFEAFVADETLRPAFVRSHEIIGEAAKEVPDDFRATHPTVERTLRVRGSPHGIQRAFSALETSGRRSG